MRRSEADRDLVWGIIWLLGGIGLSAADYQFAAISGGAYWIFIGAILYGIGRIIRGLCTLWLIR